MKEELTTKDILLWIMENTDDREAMDKISYATFPYTTKYASMYEKREWKHEDVPRTTGGDEWQG